MCLQVRGTHTPLLFKKRGGEIVLLLHPKEGKGKKNHSVQLSDDGFQLSNMLFWWTGAALKHHWRWIPRSQICWEVEQRMVMSLFRLIFLQPGAVLLFCFSF